MEVILIENIDKLGKVGDVVKVKDGYARNYLIPKKKVLRASKENLKVFEEKKTEIEAEENKRKIKSQEIAKKIKGLEILIIRNAAENGQLYGSVTSKDIAKEIISLNEVEFLNEQINLKKSIKSLGVYEVEIKEWGKPVKVQLLHDAGFPEYFQALAVKKEDIDKKAECLERLVPIIQRSHVEYIQKVINRYCLKHDFDFTPIKNDNKLVWCN